MQVEDVKAAAKLERARVRPNTRTAHQRGSSPSPFGVPEPPHVTHDLHTMPQVAAVHAHELREKDEQLVRFQGDLEVTLPA